ncbi:MAG: energy transducer TonB [Terracidiphilus sp.]
MPTDEAPIEVNEPSKPAGTSQGSGILGLSSPPPNASEMGDESRAIQSTTPVVRGSRWVDYETHELLEMIGELEDERRWARLREGVWLAILIHAALIAGIALLPKYVFKAPVVVDSNDAIKLRKEFTYLDTPKFQPPVVAKPAPIQHPLIDKQTMDEMKKAAPPAPEPTPQAAAPAPAPPPPPIPPNQQSQSQIESPRPAAVPARPNFAMNSQNPADALRDAMKGASRSPGVGMGSLPSGGGLTMHPGAGSGGVQILSDTQGVDFNNWLARWHRETMRTWDPLIPDEVNPPISKTGQLMIRFRVLPSGRLMEGSMVLEGSSGDVALDRAAWGALTGSNYPPLPREFHGPYLELRALFLYNMELPR